MVNKELDIVLKAIDNKFGQNTNVFDMKEVSILADYYVVVSALNKVNAKAIIKEIEEAILKSGYYIKAKDRDSDSGWLLIKTDNIIVHIFYDGKREYYRLEDLWWDRRI